MAEAETATKPAKSKSDKGIMLTYKPGPDDPAETTWNGHKFSANVPRAVRDEKMVELAKGNRFFEVEGHSRKAPEKPGEPKTPEAYKAYAVDWFKKAQSAKEFEQRWDDESDMRESAGVGSDDIDWLDSISMPRLAELKKLDE